MKHTLLTLSLSLFVTAAPYAAPDPNPIQVQVCRRAVQMVKLSPNPTYDGALVVLSATKEPVHFYVFDVEGVLLFHALLSPGEKKAIDGLKKGAYSYDVFHKDISVEQGKIIVQ